MFIPIAAIYITGVLFFFGIVVILMLAGALRGRMRELEEGETAWTKEREQLIERLEKERDTWNKQWKALLKERT